LNLVLVSASAKSWLCGLDFIYDSWTVRAEYSILIHGGSLKKVFVRSIKGRKFEKSILEKSQSKMEKCRINIHDCLRTVFLVMDTWKTQIEDQPGKSESTIVLKLVRARLCADMDSEQFLWKEVPLWKRAKFTLEASSGLRVARKLVGEFECNKIVVFNGREPLEAAFIEVGRNHGIPVQIIERGADATRYEVYNKSPHLSEEWWEKISNFITENPQAKFDFLDYKARDYAISKSKGIDTWEDITWSKYLTPTSDTAERLPKKPYLVFFSSSTKEVSPFEDFHDATPLETQFMALDALIEVSKELGLAVVVRRHPNSMSKNKIDREASLWLRFTTIEDVWYFPPWDTINSYFLVDHAEHTFVWISTIGFDAQVRGKSAFALGAARWDFSSSRRAWNKKEIRTALLRNSKPDSEIVFAYSNYMTHYGKRLTICDEMSRKGAFLTTEEFIPFRLVDELKQFLRKFVS